MRPKWNLRLKGVAELSDSDDDSIESGSLAIPVSSASSSSLMSPTGSHTPMEWSVNSDMQSTPVQRPEVPTQQSAKKKTRHLSLSHDRIEAKRMEEKEKELDYAVAYCQEHNCKGYKAIADLDLKYVKDARTINQRLKGNVITGEEKKLQRILTTEEENSLVKYLVNRNRACQGLTESQVEKVVLNILRVRQQLNRKSRGRNSNQLSKNALRALETNHVGLSFFRRFRSRHPQLRRKIQRKVSVKRGLRCTLETAINYIDDLADVLIKNKIAPNLVKVETGVWTGKVDLARIWAHDETPQFINYNASGQSKKLIYAGSGDDCNKISKENRECVTIQPFSNFAGDMAMCQVIFSGSGLTSHMCPPAAENKIDNLVLSVNDKGCTTGETLLAAYKVLSENVLVRKRDIGNADEVDVIIADGHKSRFNGKVMSHCEESLLEQFILPPDTSGVTQKHDQINQQLHSRYEEKKSEIYSEYADLNRECFMNILSEIWGEWATPERIMKAGKRVGISQDGLSVKWMDQKKFEQAEAILHPPTPDKALDVPNVKTPEGVRRNSAAYWKSLYLQRTEQVESMENDSFQIENVPGLLPFKKVKPKETVKRKITDVHGSLKATEVRALVEKKEQEEQAKKERKEELLLKKEESKEKFIRCKQTCNCEADVCEAIGLQQCSVCKNVLKSQCSKKLCKVDGEPPLMIFVAARTANVSRKRKRCEDEEDDDHVESSSDEYERDSSLEETDGEDQAQEIDVTSSLARDLPRTGKSGAFDQILTLQEELDDHHKGKFFCIYYDTTFYWGKCLRMFSNDPDSNVEEVDFSFMHRKHDGLWDWPKKKDEKRIKAAFVFYGPCMPLPPTKQGFRFVEEEAATRQYKLYKTHINKMGRL